jgi:molybdate transport system permease protein
VTVVGEMPRLLASAASALLLGLLLLPVAGVLSGLPADPFDPGVLGPLWLSVTTSLAALLGVVLLGTPLAWRLSRRGPGARLLGALVELPLVVPPAVVGVGLLLATGPHSPLGWLQLPFHTVAVVLAQMVVAAPLYVQAAASAFRRVDPELLLVARSLGSSPSAAMWRVALPVAAPGLAAGASLAWARALGELGATLLFAGNLPGVTQTLPLAILAALESSLQRAQVLSLWLLLLGLVALVAAQLAASRLPE